ncbi:prephenate dehydrogenase [Thermanaerovibrio velox DSM 12556]|uniref:Prephenate dehydrogenase n=1 Tax=Thermanaerovibrio velox DSM 12556 TaxID=926567 RepID=H0UNF1_9BACT|nr:prephenate dehydrogenase/arogenate dehydrogenase family protein [Thermanaerovibrio velox]EHM09358.1 prephenate dehydrogenase [Thermanaerovibrio velox DSM 12556]
MLRRHVGILGLGLIGGSMAMRLKGRCLRLSGWDGDPRVLSCAISMGILDRASSGLEDLAVGCDLLVLAVPSSCIVPLGLKAVRHLKDGAVLMDTGSVKVPVVERLDPALSGGYLGFHPMAGRERGGLGNASKDLFEGALCALVPGPSSSPETVELGKELAEELGGRWAVMGPEEHDRGVGFVSHLPMLLSAALAGSAMEASKGGSEVELLAASGFRDVTRLSLGGPDLLQPLRRMNRRYIDEALSEFLRQVREILSQEDGALGDRLQRIARWREELGRGKGWLN